MAFFSTREFWILFFTIVVGLIPIFKEMKVTGTHRPNLWGYGVITSFVVLLCLGIWAINDGVKKENTVLTEQAEKHTPDSLAIVRLSNKVTLSEITLNKIDLALSKQGYKYLDGKIIPPNNVQKFGNNGRGVILERSSNNHIDQSINTFLREYKMTPIVEKQITDSVGVLSTRYNLKCCTVQITESSNAQTFYVEVIELLRAKGYAIDKRPVFDTDNGPLKGIAYDAMDGKLYVTIGIIKN